MKLLTKEILERFAAVGSQEDASDPIIIAKFFCPWSSWTWYATEYNPTNQVFFGWVVGLENEFGYFSLDELETVRGPGGLRIERDLYFGEQPLSKVTKGDL